MCPLVNTSSGTTTITLSREIKSTDVLLVTWLKTGTPNSLHVAGQGIINPYLIDIHATFQVALEEIYTDFSSGQFYGLCLENDQNLLVGQIDFGLYLNQDGNIPEMVYAITGVYNISGK